MPKTVRSGEEKKKKPKKRPIISDDSDEETSSVKVASSLFGTGHVKRTEPLVDKEKKNTEVGTHYVFDFVESLLELDVDEGSNEKIEDSEKNRVEKVKSPIKKTEIEKEVKSPEQNIIEKPSSHVRSENKSKEEEIEIQLDKSLNEYGGRRRGATRGGSSRAANRPGPSSIDELVIRDVTEMPEGVGLETRLHTKRRKFRKPRLEQTRSRVSQAHGNVAPVLDEVPAPSSATNMECATRDIIAVGRRLLPKQLGEETEGVLNYGSEEDSGDDEDEFVPPVLISRVAQVLQDTPTEDQSSTENDVLPNMIGIDYLLEFIGFPTPPPEDTFQPRDLYQFDWQPFPEAPVEPSLRRERFSQTNVGPTVSLTDPYELFVSIWDRKIMSVIVEETNRHAQQRVTSMMEQGTLKPESRICRWKDTDVDELYVFFAIMIAMGSVVKSYIEDYWSTNTGILTTPGFAAYMSYNRYFLLMTCLHFRNNDDMYSAELSYSEAKLFKIDPILKHLNSKFQGNYVLGQNLSLDESLLLWKGRLDINVLIPNKAASVGIKSFEVCESQTGYLWRFEIHAQKKGSEQQLGDILKSSAPAIVLRLISGLENKGYTLWMDNYYNSPALARHLKSTGFDCVGTLRTNRMFVPQALHSLTKAQMKPGQITGLTSGDVDVMVWRDVNRVAMISTYHGNAVVRDLQSTIPILIHDYNIAMGGVDKKDQMVASFPVERKRSKVWYKKLFKRLLNVSIHNSYIIHKHNTHTTRAPTLDSKNFREKLINTLLAKHAITPQSPTRHRQSSSGIQLPVPTQNLEVPTHRLSEYPMAGAQRLRRKCAVCRKRVITFCVGCDKAMCIAGDCFVAAHTPP